MVPHDPSTRPIALVSPTRNVAAGTPCESTTLWSGPLDEDALAMWRPSHYRTLASCSR